MRSDTQLPAGRGGGFNRPPLRGTTAAPCVSALSGPSLRDSTCDAGGVRNIRVFWLGLALN